MSRQQLREMLSWLDAMAMQIGEPMLADAAAELRRMDEALTKIAADARDCHECGSFDIAWDTQHPTGIAARGPCGSVYCHAECQWHAEGGESVCGPAKRAAAASVTP
jgi:hypothetical protein